MNFLVRRVKKYETRGRSQTEEESAKIHDRIRDMLHAEGRSFFEIDGNEKGLDFAEAVVRRYLAARSGSN